MPPMRASIPLDLPTAFGLRTRAPGGGESNPGESPTRKACFCNGPRARPMLGAMATPPRKIDKGMFFYVTVRAMHRRYRFVPKRRIRAAIQFCLTAVLEKYRDEGKIELYEFVFMSNHYHLLGRDLVGCLPKFVQEFNALLSAELNALRGTSDSNFSRKPYGLVQVHGDARLIEHAVYTLANPIAAYLVARARHWPGVSSLKLEYGQSVVVDKPRGGLWSGRAGHACRRASQRSKRAAYANRSVLPDQAELTLDRPPVMLHLTDSELRQHIRDRLAERERELERTRRNIRVVGRRRVLSMHYDGLDLPSADTNLPSPSGLDFPDAESPRWDREHRTDANAAQSFRAPGWIFPAPPRAPARSAALRTQRWNAYSPRTAATESAVSTRSRYCSRASSSAWLTRPTSASAT